VAAAVLELALQEPELSPRELATAFIDQRQYFVSEASIYRLLKAHWLITSPAFILLKAADLFAQPTTAPNQLWQTDFTYLRVVGWGWFYLSTVLDDFSRYIPGLEAVLHHDRCRRHGDAAAGAQHDRTAPCHGAATAAVVERQRTVLSVGAARRLAGRTRHEPYARQTLSSDDSGQERALPRTRSYWRTITCRVN
jgi:integrase-like protein